MKPEILSYAQIESCVTRHAPQAHVEMRDQNGGSGGSSGSSSHSSSVPPGTPARVMRDQRDEIEALSQELREFKRDIDGLRARRNDDLEFFLSSNNNNKKGSKGNKRGRSSKVGPTPIDMRPEWRSD